MSKWYFSDLLFHFYEVGVYIFMHYYHYYWIVKVYSYTPINTHKHTHVDEICGPKSQRPCCQNSWTISSIWKSEACSESDLNKLESPLHCMSFQVSGIRLNILQYRHRGAITQQKWHIYPAVMWFWVENWSRGVITYHISSKGSLSLLHSKGIHTGSEILFSQCGMSGQCFAVMLRFI